MSRLARALVAVTLLATACTTDGGGGEETTSTTVPVVPSTIRVASRAWPACLNPLLCDDDGVASSLVLQHVLPKLFDVDQTGRLVPSPVLADVPDVEVLDDGRQRIVYRLAEEARWHDGRPMTSSDLVGTWLAIQATEGARQTGYSLIESIDDDDALSAVVVLRRPYADWRELFGGRSGWILQPDAFDAGLDLSDDLVDGLPFGAGPYELTSFDADLIVLTARESHWAIDRSALVEEVRIERLATGGSLAGVDIVLPGLAATGAAPEEVESMTRRATPIDETVGLFLDRRTPALRELAVRTAIDAVLDRDDLVALMTPFQVAPFPVVPCLGWLPGNDACDAVLPATPSDPVRAGALLDAAGWVRIEDGRRARGFDALTIGVSHDPDLRGSSAVADAIRFRLRALGITVEVTPRTAAEWEDRARTGTTGIGVYAVPLGTAGRLRQLLVCPSGTNRLDWCDEGLSETLARLRDAVTDDGRAAIGRQASSVAAQELAWLPLQQRHETWYSSDRVEVPDDQPSGLGPLAGLERFATVD